VHAGQFSGAEAFNQIKCLRVDDGNPVSELVGDVEEIIGSEGKVMGVVQDFRSGLVERCEGSGTFLRKSGVPESNNQKECPETDSHVLSSIARREIGDCVRPTRG